MRIEEFVVEFALEQRRPIVIGREVARDEYRKGAQYSSPALKEPKEPAAAGLCRLFSAGSTDKSSARGWSPAVPGDALSHWETSKR
jgi:hypothetical protein